MFDLFILKEWDKFCEEITSNYKFIRADQILSQSDDASWILIKHDVETNVMKALAVAKIEAKHNIYSTFYVQSYLLENNYKALLEIQSMGHEVTYHYDVLDSNGGCYQSSASEFKHTIEKFKEYGFDVTTVCPHGNPIMNRNGWSSNKDFFRNENVRNYFSDIFDIVVDLPKMVKGEVIYISDAGYGWKQIVNIENNDQLNEGDREIDDLNAIEELIGSNKKVIISTHPHRWEESRFKAVVNSLLFKFIRIIVKPLARIGIINRILSKFYYLAKKI